MTTTEELLESQHALANTAANRNSNTGSIVSPEAEAGVASSSTIMQVPQIPPASSAAAIRTIGTGTSRKDEAHINIASALCDAPLEEQDASATEEASGDMDAASEFEGTCASASELLVLEGTTDTSGPMWKLAGQVPLPVRSRMATVAEQEGGAGAAATMSIRKKQQPINSLLAKTMKTHKRRVTEEIEYSGGAANTNHHTTGGDIEDGSSVLGPHTASTSTLAMEHGATPTVVPSGQEALVANLAKKRTRVVPLLLGGLVGLLGGFFANVYTQTSCHFATVSINVGEYQSPFKFHYGMWKYTPIDSVFAGYSYCTYYSNASSSADIPALPRLLNALGLVAGFLALGVLWTYLILGVTRKWAWQMATGLFGLASVTNFMTYFFFVGQVCRSNECHFGPSAYVVLVSTSVWALLAYIAHENTPLSILFDSLAEETANHNNSRNRPSSSSSAPGEQGLLTDRDIHRRAKSVLNWLPLKGVQKNVPSLSTFSKRQGQSAYLHYGGNNSGSQSNSGSGSASASDTQAKTNLSSGGAVPAQEQQPYKPPDISEIV
jgi:hypothetical protein